MSKKILIVDDDRTLCELLQDYLRQFDFHADYALLPSRGLRRLSQETYDALVLDVMMPEMDGFEFARRARAAGARLPLLMLSARGEVTDRVVGLEAGADDYLPKPFEPRELAARLVALCRRPALAAGGNERAEYEGLRLYPARMQAEIFQDGEWRDAQLTDSEIRILLLLAEDAPAVVSRDTLSARLHGLEFDIADRSLDITISRLRYKLGESPQKPRFIRTARNVGYALIAAKKLR